MGFAQHMPLPHQPENYLIDGNRWQQNYSIELTELPSHLDGPADLWGEGNRVPHVQITQGLYVVPQSLYLVQVDNLDLYTTDDDRRRASFTYNGINYDLAVTDPKFDEIVREQREVTGILCISLGEEYQGYCYKLVATIF